LERRWLLRPKREQLGVEDVVMEIHLPEDLERFVHDQVRAGKFPSEEQVVRQALEHFMLAQQPVPAAPQTNDPWLGSMREDAALLDEIVEEAMRIREERPWRLPAGE
jgi:Arc/MetJ-type ribon-helix-helix transcriptional regulator